MAGPGAWQRLRALLRRRDAPLFLHDASALDLADDAAFEAPPRLHKLRAVVADDGDGEGEGAGAGPGPDAAPDDDALLEPDVPLAPSRLSLKADEPCARCRRRRDSDALRRRRVSARLALAALLYLLFMVGELVGESAGAGSERGAGSPPRQKQKAEIHQCRRSSQR